MSETIEVHPVAGKHAIEVMALAVEWDRHMSPEALAQVEEVYRRTDVLQRLLPSMDKIRGVSLHFGDDGAAVSTPEEGGLQLAHIGNDGKPTWVVSVRPDLIACNCMVYDRWDKVKPKALDILMPMIECGLTAGYLIQAVGLQYQDSFRIQTGEPLEATRRLFREGGAWLSPHAWKTNGSWHIHQGWFSASASGRRVHNLLNVDFVSEVGSSVVRINGQHRSQGVGIDGQDPQPFELADVSATLDGLHLDNKLALHSLLSDSVCNQIGLTVPEEM
ncbi:TIGR04255 family protein [Aquabacterium lacunae]|uniref:TIGR04255 family protein n=1 Tax=Aquabacterium lacunae TaxID=2528630 RepID=A0A4Q9GZ89_9BURK|nr:TIGR04255 family protein [Aquabacterium lacunae]TBO31320.1 TIGR04255 family protein [Aquabacterium lacunae]